MAEVVETPEKKTDIQGWVRVFLAPMLALIGILFSSYLALHFVSRDEFEAYKRAAEEKYVEHQTHALEMQYFKDALRENTETLKEVKLAVEGLKISLARKEGLSNGNN